MLVLLEIYPKEGGRDNVQCIASGNKDSDKEGHKDILLFSSEHHAISCMTIHCAYQYYVHAVVLNTFECKVA